ncbi:MAG: hypothetical protein BGO49_20395 [Planctomycetales bacterium 71-10]|nr:MAG: hypothetical protein BGO49_20395 [Planctomycetales bacterium 71-10]
MAEILHVTARDKWEQAVAEGQYRGDTLATEGFTHCCLSGQLSGVVSRYFRGQTELVVLRIAPDRLKPPLSWENPPGSDDVFPHVYGPINLDAVVEVVPLEDVLGR